MVASGGFSRPSCAAPHDQKRLTTPAEAIRAGSDYLVIGRPIIEMDDPVAAAFSRRQLVYHRLPVTNGETGPQLFRALALPRDLQGALVLFGLQSVSRLVFAEIARQVLCASEARENSRAPKNRGNERAARIR